MKRLMMFLSLVLAMLPNISNAGGPDGSEMMDRSTRNPLQSASYDGLLEEVKTLISQGGNINERADYQWTALFFASAKGHRDIVEYLLLSGSELDARDSWGERPLHYASRYGHLDVVEFLTSKGSDINKISRGTWRSPLHLASMGGHSLVVKFLVERGAHLNEKDLGGNTALHYAVKTKNLDSCKVLIGSGALADIKNNQGKNPKELADLENPEMISCFGEETPVTRTSWEHNNGSFLKEGNIWQEYNGEGYFVASFKEVGRDLNWVKLYDSSRDMQVFLGENRSLWIVGRNGTWHGLYQGSWKN